TASKCLFGELPHEPAITLSLGKSAIPQKNALLILDRHVQRSHEATDRAGEINHGTTELFLEIADGGTNEIGAHARVGAAQGFRVAVPLHDDAGHAGTFH